MIRAFFTSQGLGPGEPGFFFGRARNGQSISRNECIKVVHSIEATWEKVAESESGRLLVSRTTDLQIRFPVVCIRIETGTNDSVGRLVPIEALVMRDGIAFSHAKLVNEDLLWIEATTRDALNASTREIALLDVLGELAAMRALIAGAMQPIDPVAQVTRRLRAEFTHIRRRTK